MTELRRALITRPREDSSALAEALKRRGIEPVSAPMMTVAYVPAEIEDAFEACQAVLFTSRNGVRALCRLTQRRDRTAYAVGDGTADAAQENGFASVRSASGDSRDLARLVVDTLKPENGPLLHPAGATVAGDLSGALEKAGFRTIRRATYEAEPVAELPPGALAALRNGAVDCILFFSPRTARIFLDLVAAAGIGSSLDGLVALCLSDAVAKELDPAAWREIRVAAAPTSEAMVKMLESDSTARPAAPESAVVSRRAPSWRRAAAAVGIVAVVAAAGYAAFVSWRFSEGGDSARIASQIRENVARAEKESEERNAVLARRVEQAETGLAEAAGRLDELAARLASVPDRADEEAAERAALAEKVARLEEAITELRNSEAEARTEELRRADETDRLSSSLAALVARVGELERLAKERQSVGGALALAAGQLRNAMSRSAPYAAELAVLERLAVGDRRVATALAPLAAGAESGIPSRAVLFAKLPAAVAAAAANRPEAEGGWIDRMSRWLRGLVKARRIDGKGDGADARLARAELAAGRGDLAAAAQELSGLRGESAQAAAPWLAAARSRLEAESAMAELDRIVLEELPR